jgi:hypothetical protein
MVQDLCASVVKAATGLATMLKANNEVGELPANKINAAMAGVGPIPRWAAGSKDSRDVLHWDSEQYVAEVLVGDHLALGVVDTGSCKTLLCETTARALGLTVERARGNEFGTFRVPGGTDAKSYVGVVRGPITLKFSNDVSFDVCNVRVLSHPAPLFLIGSDLLRGGRDADAWNFNGL